MVPLGGSSVVTNSSIASAEPRDLAAGPAERQAGEAGVQAAGFLLELSLDWMVLRASENVHRFLGESHVTLIDEPLARFVQAQPLHDVRNLFSRLSGTTGIARAYHVCLTDNRQRFDIAFQLSDGRVLLEGLPSPDQGLGEAIGTVGGLIEGLGQSRGSTLLEGAARRVRALTGFDRALVACRDEGSERSAESSRGSFASPSSTSGLDDLPPIIADTAAAPVAVYPRKEQDRSLERAILRAPTAEQSEQLRALGIASTLRVPMSRDGRNFGVIHCDNRTACAPTLELHAASELFAQMLAMRLTLDKLRPS
jgi:light-regulated signal transduction histidine kinase (bacteriophytochrome)